jgi:hypothetical protein
MLETIDAVMIAAAVVILLISLAYQPKGAERRPASRRCSRSPGSRRVRDDPRRGWGAHGAIEVGRFGMLGGALVLMWLWVRLGHNRRGRVSS